MNSVMMEMSHQTMVTIAKILVNLLGCSSRCTIESGWRCTVSNVTHMSVCTRDRIVEHLFQSSRNSYLALELALPLGIAFVTGVVIAIFVSKVTVANGYFSVIPKEDQDDTA